MFQVPVGASLGVPLQHFGPLIPGPGQGFCFILDDRARQLFVPSLYVCLHREPLCLFVCARTPQRLARHLCALRIADAGNWVITGKLLDQPGISRL